MNYQEEATDGNVIKRLGSIAFEWNIYKLLGVNFFLLEQSAP